MITLTAEEREKFIAWLEQETLVDAEMVAQMGKIGVSDGVSKHYHAEMLALSIVLARLKGEPS